MTASDDLRRLNDESRVRLAAVADLREQHQRITRHSSRRLEASRRLLEREQLRRQV